MFNKKQFFQVLLSVYILFKFYYYIYNIFLHMRVFIMILNFALFHLFS
jgi:hypothetical protein